MDFTDGRGEEAEQTGPAHAGEAVDRQRMLRASLLAVEGQALGYKRQKWSRGGWERAAKNSAQLALALFNSLCFMSKCLIM